MMPIFIVFKWSPAIPAYFFAFISLLMAFVNYKVVSEWFSKFVAKISTLIILVSPMWLQFTRDSRFYFLFTLFSYFYFYFLIKGIREKKVLYLYYSILVLFFMLHLHYVALVFILSTLVIIYSKRKKLRFSIRRGILYALIPSIPFLVVNLKQGFQPLLKTAAWIPYRISGFLGIVENNNFSKEVFINNVRSIALIYRWQFYWKENIAANLLAYCMIIFTVYLVLRARKKSYKLPLTVLLITLFILYGSLFIHGSPPYHYYIGVMFIPPIIIALLMENIRNKYKVLSEKLIIFIFATLLISVNYQYYMSEEYLRKKYEVVDNRVPYNLQLKIADKIIRDTGSSPYKLKRVGPFDYYDGYFAQNYQYLLWWMGNEPRENSSVLYTIHEGSDGYEHKNEEEVVFNEYDVIVTKRGL